VSEPVCPNSFASALAVEKGCGPVVAMIDDPVLDCIAFQLLDRTLQDGLISYVGVGALR
jgi:hypothetical protein